MCAEHFPWKEWSQFLRPLFFTDFTGRIRVLSPALAAILDTKPGRDDIVRAAERLVQNCSAACAAECEQVERTCVVRSHRRAYRLTVHPSPFPEIAAHEEFLHVIVVERAGRTALLDKPPCIAGVSFTPREYQVATLLRARFSASEVARALGVSVHTARRHIENVYRKTKATGGRQSLYHVLDHMASVGVGTFLPCCEGGAPVLPDTDDVDSDDFT